MTKAVSTLPFLFTYKDAVYGNGFLADVNAFGRVLARQEDDGWWFYGVTPGDLAASGASLVEAHAEFRKGFRAILFDIAEEVQSFEDFKSSVEAFFHQSNAVTLNEWDTAVEEVRRVGLDKKTDMLVRPANSKPVVEVAMKEQRDFTTADNILDEPEPALAA